jgi:zinc/manganese transport system substrate-binding protein
MLKIKTFNFLILVVLVLASPAALAEKLEVVTTTTDLASIAEAVGGDAVSVKSICTGKEDPHFLQARPGYILKARDADLWIRIGRELEVGWEGPILEGSRNNRIHIGGPAHLDASRDALILDLPSDKVTRAMGDVHPSGNPHYWLDPWNGRIVSGTIAQKLAELMPEKAADFAAGRDRFRRELDERMFGPALVADVGGEILWGLQLAGELDGYLKERGMEDRLGGWSAAMRPCKGAAIVTYHRSWVYFANRFGLSIAGELEPKPGIPPTAGHLAEIMDRMKSRNVRVVLQENFYSPKAGRSVAERTGAKLVVTANSVGGEAAAKDYLSLMDLIVGRVSEAFGNTEEGPQS